MPIQITISGDTAVEALRELHGLSAGLVVPDTRLVAEEVPAEEEKVFPGAPKRRGRPPKAVEPVQETAPEAETSVAEQNTAQAPDADQETDQADDKPFTVDDARKALSDLLAQPDGKTKAQAVFAEMKCTKLSEIPEGEFKAFIAAIAKARGL